MSDFVDAGLPQRISVEVAESDPVVSVTGAVDSVIGTTLTLTVAADAVPGFEPGVKVHASYCDHTGLCQFDSEVVQVRPGDPTALVIDAPRHITTTQRRQHVRADVELEIACALLDRGAMSFLSAPGRVQNLGGGGLMMIIAPHETLTVGAKLALALPLPGGPPVMAVATIVDLAPPSEEDEPAVVRMAFNLIAPNDRDWIERFTYQKLGGKAPAKLWGAGKISPIPG